MTTGAVPRAKGRSPQAPAQTRSIDHVNSAFYTAFPFPWPADLLFRLEDEDLWRVLLNQELGYFGSGPVPEKPKIWIAGCGTNQAAQIGLRFPQAEIHATDLSGKALSIAEATSRSVGLRNINFERASINAGTNSRFDYVICTGVIHHNADPLQTVGCLVSALKPAGVLELMVYNRFHRTQTSAVQEAVRLLVGEARRYDYSSQLEVATRLVDGLAGDSSVRDLLGTFRSAHSSRIADALIQPIERSYTVNSLSELLTQAGARLWLPTQNAFDLASRRSWLLPLSDPVLLGMYRNLSDVKRWQLSNLLIAEKSPWLWFYARPKAVVRKPLLEDVINSEFLETRFKPVRTAAHAYIRDGHRYRRAKSRSHPARAALNGFDAVVRLMDGKNRIVDAVRQIAADPSCASELRLALTTPFFPYLKAIQDSHLNAVLRQHA